MAALDGPKRSKSLCMRYSCSTALRSTDLACRRTRKSLGAPPPLAWNPITQSRVEVYFQFRVSARCSLLFGMCDSHVPTSCVERERRVSRFIYHHIKSSSTYAPSTIIHKQHIPIHHAALAGHGAHVHVLFVLSIILIPSSYINCSTTIDVCGTPASRVRTHPLRAHARWPSPCDWRAGARTRPIAGSVGSLQEQCCARQRATSRSRRSSSRGVRQRAREPLLRAHGRCPPRWARQWIHQPPRRRPPPSLHRLLARRQQCVERWSERAAREPPTAP